MFTREIREWLGHLALSLLIGCVVGALAYLVARAGFTGYLLYQQQQFVQETVGLLRNGGGIEGLAGSNLRELRQQVEALDAQYTRLSVQIGLIMAALTAVASYIRLEYRAYDARNAAGQYVPESE